MSSLKRTARHLFSDHHLLIHHAELRRGLAAFAGDARAHRPGRSVFTWPPFVLPGAPLSRRVRHKASEQPASTTALSLGTIGIHGSSRYFGHALVLGLALIVAVVGNFGQSASDLHSWALDRAAELPSAFAHPIDQAQDDVLVKPPALVTQLVNRPRQGITTYRVQEGDTVESIADKFDISIPTVLWANGLTEDAVLTSGRQLEILPVSGVLHTVQPGERIEDIASRYQTDQQAIIDFNQLTDPEHLSANEVLVIPGGRIEEQPRPEPVARSDARPAAQDQSSSSSAAMATAASSAAPASQPKREFSYTVANGDTLSGIAQKFGVSVETIIWANGLQDDPEQISQGQTLTILPTSGALHTVQAGESLLEIAQQYGVDPDKIVSANALASADALSVGQKLIIPGAKLLTADELAAQKEAAQAEAEAQARASAAATGAKYTVAEGDSLLAIAEKYGVAASRIVQVNGLSSADVLAVGQELIIPGARAIQVAAAPARSAAPQAPRASVAVAAAAAPAPAPKPAPPAPQPVLASSGGGNKIVSIASQYLGYRYTWGGQSPSTGFDCSGFTWYVYEQAGLRIPVHDLWGQLQAGPRIAKSNLQPGDLVFFQNTYTYGLSHSGIYIGGGRFINAEDYGKGVAVANINDGYWGPRFLGASRPW